MKKVLYYEPSTGYSEVEAELLVRKILRSNPIDYEDIHIDDINSNMDEDPRAIEEGETIFFDLSCAHHETHDIELILDTGFPEKLMTCIDGRYDGPETEKKAMERGFPLPYQEDSA